MKRIVFPAVAFVTALTFAGTSHAQALDGTVAVGGDGGGEFSVDCGTDSVLAGLRLRSGGALDNIAALCVGVGADGGWQGQPAVSGGTFGGGGGSSARLRCPADHAVTGFTGSRGGGVYDYVAGSVTLACRPLASAVVTAGDTVSTDTAGVEQPDALSASCEGDAAARGLYGRSGGLVDRYGLLCNVPGDTDPDDPDTDPDGPSGPRPDVEGRWSGVADWPLIAIHAVLTPQGEVLTFGTDDSGVQGALYFYDVWNPDRGTGANSHRTLDNTLDVDSFCSAPLVVPETGDILMPGGDARFGEGKNQGIVDAPVFSPETGELSRGSDMQFARWYPTATTLPNGEILLVGGIDGGGTPSVTPEIYSPSGGRWRSLFGASSAEAFGADESRWWYPRQWVAPNGELFGMASSIMYYLDPAGDGSVQIVGDIPFKVRNWRSTAVMYQPGRILQLGGEADEGAITVDINGALPTVRPTGRMSFNRNSWANSTVLPDGTVLATGGGAVDNELEGAVLTAELWDPDSGTWTSMADAQLARLYHSSSLLLPDGRVLVGGGGAPGPLTNTNVEIYSPPYLFEAGGAEADRPEIVSAAAQASPGEALRIVHTGAEEVTRVTMIKTGAVTHSFNMDQRFIELSFTGGDGVIEARLPGSSNTAPPGYYQVFLLDADGTPSRGHMLNLDTDA